MAVVRITRTAAAEYDEIIAYVRSVGGPSVALKYERAFDRIFDEISHYPGIGALRQRLGASVRLVPIAPYSLYYEGDPKGEVVFVLRIVRGSRRMTRQLINEAREG